MSNHEGFAHIAQRKWAIVSESLRSLTKNEQMSESLIFLSELLICSFLGKKWAIRSENRWANSQLWKWPSVGRSATSVEHCCKKWRSVGKSSVWRKSPDGFYLFNKKCSMKILWHCVFNSSKASHSYGADYGTKDSVLNCCYKDADKMSSFNLSYFFR